MNPFPTVRIRGRLTRVGARIRLLAVRAPAGTRVVARCRGGGCLSRAQRARVPAPAGADSGRVRLRRLERAYRAGVRLEIFVIKSGAIGKYTRFRIRRTLAPARSDRCVGPDQLNRPSACPR
jgi:hypothetical protein